MQFLRETHELPGRSWVLNLTFWWELGNLKIICLLKLFKLGSYNWVSKFNLLK